MSKRIKKILKGIGIFLVTVVGLAVLFVLVLTVTEFRPKDVEEIEILNEASQKVSVGDSLKVMSWNVGYAGLGENADFFMDGGASVASADKEEVLANVQAIVTEIESENPDVVLLQEVDVNSTRSHYVKMKSMLDEALSQYESTFAANYKTLWVPYPWPNLGKIHSGIVTYSRLDQISSERVALPCPFSYPISLCNLKRCLMVNRIPVEGSDKELVIVNLHLEAYDSGEGKAAQTKQLKELLLSETQKGNYVIAGGDFNQIFSNVDVSKFPQTSEDRWMPGSIDVNEFDGLQMLMDEDTPSCRSLDKPLAGSDKDTFQYYIIDGFILSSNVKVERAEVMDLEFKNADHNPFLLEVELQ